MNEINLKEILKKLNTFKDDDKVSIHLNILLGRKKSNIQEITFKDICEWYNTKIQLNVLITDNINQVKVINKNPKLTINNAFFKRVIKKMFEIGYSEGFEDGVSEAS